MKRIISISLLLLLLLPVAVTVSWLNMEKHLVRKSIKRKIISGIDKSELVALTFHKNEINTTLKWKHSKEFEYKGQMYDIVETSIGSDSIQYWCWWDFEETQLNKKLDNLLASAWNQHPPKNEKHQLLFEWMEDFYFQPFASILPSSTSILSILTTNEYSISIPPYRAPLPLAPPPEHVSS